MKRPPAFKKKMDRAKMKPQDVQAVKDLERLGITEKTDLIGMQKKNPPFRRLERGAAGIPAAGYLSPRGRSMNRERCITRIPAGPRGCLPVDFGPGISARSPSATTWSPLPSCWMNPCVCLGCRTIPAGRGQHRTSDPDPEGPQGHRIFGHPQFSPCDPAAFQGIGTQS